MIAVRLNQRTIAPTVVLGRIQPLVLLLNYYVIVGTPTQGMYHSEPAGEESRVLQITATRDENPPGVGMTLSRVIGINLT